MKTREFLEHIADPMIDHTDDTCGLCARQLIQAEVAKALLAKGEEPGDEVIKEWSAESERLWKQSKFVKLWEEEKAAGRDPLQAFEQRGWEP